MKRTSGVMVLAVLAGMAVVIIGVRDVIVRGLIARGVGPVPVQEPVELPPLPAFPYETMEPEVRAQFTAAAERAEADPDDAGAAGDLGNLFLAYGFHALAIPCFERAASLAPQAWQWRYRLGVALYERGEWADAAAQLDRVLTRRPDDVAALLHRAESSRRLNHTEQAIAGFRRVIELAPDQPRAWGGLGQAELRMGNLEAASADLAEALRLAPRYGPARYALGRVLRSEDRLDEATAELKQAEAQREIEPPLDPALTAELASLRTGAIDALHRGIDLARAGDLDQAAALFEKAIRIDPDLAEAHSQLGAARLAAGDQAAAETHLRRAVELDPDFADAQYNLGLLAHRDGRFDEAVARFEQAVAIRPDHYDAHLGLGTDLPRVGRAAEAPEHLRRAIALRPDRPRPYKRLAELLSEAGEFEQAAATLRSGMQQLPGDASIADRLAWLLATCPDMKLRDPHGALPIAEGVCRVTGEREPRAMDTLAAALAANGRFDEAVEVATRAREVAVAGGKADLAAEIGRHLEAFQAGRPWLENGPAH